MRLNQAQFGDLVGVSQGTVSKWESGQQRPEFTMGAKIAGVTGLDVTDLIFGDEEHTFINRGILSPIKVKGSISDTSYEQSFWERDEWFDIYMPLFEEWEDLDALLFGMIVNDESSNLLFEQNTIVIFVETILDRTDPKNGDIVLLSLQDEETQLYRNKLFSWSKNKNKHPVLSPTSDYDYIKPLRLDFRNKLEILSLGGYSRVGLLGIAVGSIAHLNPGRFPRPKGDPPF